MATLPKPSLPTHVVRTKSKPSRLKLVHPPVELQETIAAAKAKTHFLELLDRVDTERHPITITKRGRVIAHLVPPPTQEHLSNFDRAFGSMKGTGKILGDIVSPDWESWGPDWR